MCNFWHPALTQHQSEWPDVKNYTWWLNPVWHRMLYSCTHMATVSVKRLETWQSVLTDLHPIQVRMTSSVLDTGLDTAGCHTQTLHRPLESLSHILTNSIQLHCSHMCWFKSSKSKCLPNKNDYFFSEWFNYHCVMHHRTHDSIILIPHNTKTFTIHCHQYHYS